MATDAPSIASLFDDPTVDVVAEYSTLDPAERAELDELTARVSPRDLTLAALSVHEGTEIRQPEPDAGYTAADLQRLIDLRERAVHLAAGVRSMP